MNQLMLVSALLLSLISISCGSKGSIEQVPTTTVPTTPAPTTPTTPTTQSLLVPPKQFLGGNNLITGSGGGQTYIMAVGLNHYDNTTMVNGSYKLIIGQPQQALSP